MKIAIVGSGHVGLVTGACLAEIGHSVVCVDKDAARIDTLLAGRVPIFEPGLDELVARHAGAGRLSFSTDVGRAVAKAQVVFIAVGTPPRPGDGNADLGFVRQAAADVARAVTGPTVVVMKSTVPVGTGDLVEAIVAEARPPARVAVVSNPEFLREGAAVFDFLHPDRIVIGTDERWARAIMARLYEPLTLAGAPMVMTRRRSAELIKYASNAFLAAKISFINEISDLCEEVGADVADVSLGVGLDGRIGPQFLSPGPGYGGSCFPKDTLALLRTAEASGVRLRLVESAVAVNDARKSALARRVADALGGSVHGASIAVLGLTFKPDTEDMREAPSLPLVRRLQNAGARVRAHDPVGMAEAARLLPGVRMFDDPYACAAGADAVVLVTAWASLASLDLARLKAVMRTPVFVDLRNAYDPAVMHRRGFVYSGIGRGDGEPPRAVRARVVASAGRRGDARPSAGPSASFAGAALAPTRT